MQIFSFLTTFPTTATTHSSLSLFQHIYIPDKPLNTIILFPVFVYICIWHIFVQCQKNGMRVDWKELLDISKFMVRMHHLPKCITYVRRTFYDKNANHEGNILGISFMMEKFKYRKRTLKFLFLDMAESKSNWYDMLVSMNNNIHYYSLFQDIGNAFVYFRRKSNTHINEIFQLIFTLT